MKAIKTGTQRKRDYDARQRAQGRRPIQFWLNDEEKQLLAKLLAWTRITGAHLKRTNQIGTQRKQDCSARQRAQGSQPVQFWLNDKEKQLLSELLAWKREKDPA